MKKLLIIIIILTFIIGGFVGFNLYMKNQLKPVDTSNTSLITFEIPSGSSTKVIAEILNENNLIGSSLAFSYYSKKHDFDGKYQAGTYRLAGNLSMLEVMNEIANGNTLKNVTTFTIPEGYTIAQVADTLYEQGLIDRDLFADALIKEYDYWFLNDINLTNTRLEGFLFPDTYEIYSNATEEDIIVKMLNRFEQIYSESFIDRTNELGLDVYDVIIMASLVEREGLIDSERSTISSVFYNRLDENIALQSCATVQYILGEPKAKLSIADTRIESPFNTYLHPGLPPGPIASPGLASIEAALYPKDTDYYYFLAKGDGSHIFSKTYDDFLINKEKYIGD